MSKDKLGRTLGGADDGDGTRTEDERGPMSACRWHPESFASQVQRLNLHEWPPPGRAQVMMAAKVKDAS